MKNKENPNAPKGKFWLRVITLLLAALMVLGLAFYTVYAIIYQIREGRKSTLSALFEIPVTQAEFL